MEKEDQSEPKKISRKQSIVLDRIQYFENLGTKILPLILLGLTTLDTNKPSLKRKLPPTFNPPATKRQKVEIVPKLDLQSSSFRLPFVEEVEKDSQRDCAIQEILTTEITYVSLLGLLIKVSLCAHM